MGAVQGFEMIDLRQGFARIGYVLLAVWQAIFIGMFAYGVANGTVNWSGIGEIGGYLFLLMVGFPVAVFLLWRLLLWLLSGFIRDA